MYRIEIRKTFSFYVLFFNSLFFIGTTNLWYGMVVHARKMLLYKKGSWCTFFRLLAICQLRSAQFSQLYTHINITKPLNSFKNLMVLMVYLHIICPWLKRWCLSFIFFYINDPSCDWAHFRFFYCVEWNDPKAKN